MHGIYDVCVSRFNLQMRGERFNAVFSVLQNFILQVKWPGNDKVSRFTFWSLSRGLLETEVEVPSSE